MVKFWKKVYTFLWTDWEISAILIENLIETTMNGAIL